MQFDEFINSTKEDAPPQSLSEPLQAMWYARKGDWETAHNIAQSISSELGSWIHAYLHRVEGKPQFQGSTEAEADDIINSIL